MSYFTARISKQRIDKEGFIKALDRAAREELYNASMAFLKAVILRVPVWSGMARASLLPLARYLNQHGSDQPVEVPIHPTASAIAKVDVAARQRAGIYRGRVFNFRFLNGLYTMTFNPQVFHYRVNDISDPRPEIHLINEPIPWFSFEAGKIAFDSYWHRFSLPRLKLNSPHKFLRTTKQSVGPKVAQ